MFRTNSYLIDKMGKLNALLLALSVLMAQGAIIRPRDAHHNRVERSPCHECSNPGSPPPPPGHFHAQQWSGVTKNGNQKGVFSGASASLGDENEDSDEAFSLAFTADGSPAVSTSYVVHSGDLNSGSGFGRVNSQSQSSNNFLSSGSTGQTDSFHAQSGSSGGKTFSAGSNSQASNSGFSGQSSVNPNSHSSASLGRQEFHSSQSDNQDNTGHIGSQFGGPVFGGSDVHSTKYEDSSSFGKSDTLHRGSHSDASGFNEGEHKSGGYNGNAQHSASFAANQQHIIGSGISGSSHGHGARSQSESHSSAGGFSGSKQESGRFEGQEQQSARLGGGQQQSVGSGSSLSNSAKTQSGSHKNGVGYSSGEQYVGGFSSSHKYSTGSEGKQQQSVGIGSSGSSFGDSRIYHAGDHPSGLPPPPPPLIILSGSGNGYSKTQSSLNEALNLAHQGIQVAGQIGGCSTCGKGDNALSNAKSGSGNSVALSVSG